MPEFFKWGNAVLHESEWTEKGAFVDGRGKPKTIWTKNNGTTQDFDWEAYEKFQKDHSYKKRGGKRKTRKRKGKKKKRKSRRKRGGCKTCGCGANCKCKPGKCDCKKTRRKKKRKKKTRR